MPAQNYTKQIFTRITETQFRDLVHLSGQLDMNMSEFIRAALLREMKKQARLAKRT